MSFGDDWPGVFIRGDNAMAYSIAVKDAIMRLEGKAATEENAVQGYVVLGFLRSLAELLESCRVNHDT